LEHLKDFTIERFKNNGIKSALIYNTKNRPKKIKILLNGHLDVVPGKNYKPSIKNGYLYGVGALDMKASAACLITTFKKVAGKVDYPLGLQLVTDEEVGGSNGTKYQVKMGVRADFVIAGEPTNFDIVHEAKGVLWLKITSKGSTAHGAYPWRGQNAILLMDKFLSKLMDKYPTPAKEAWKTTINIASINTTNKALNKIPDECTTFLDIRYIPKDTKVVISSIRKLLNRNLKMTILENEPPLPRSVDNPFVKKLQQASVKVLGKKNKRRGANGTSDARHFTSVGCPGIEFGPVGKNIGGDQECVNISSLENYSKILEEFLLSITS